MANDPLEQYAGQRLLAKLGLAPAHLIAFSLPSTPQLATPAVAREHDPMSIWTDLLIMRGHIATSTALALVTAPRPVPAPAAGTDEPARDRDGGDEPCPGVDGSQVAGSGWPAST